MYRIDCQSHLYPRAFFEILARNTQAPCAEMADGKTVVQYPGLAPVFMREEAFDLTRKLAAMDEAAVDLALLCHVIPGPCVLAPELAEQGAQAINDHIGEVVQRHPQRFAGLACLPWQDAPAAIREIDRAAGMGMVGVVLYSHVGGKAVDDPAFEPIYAHIAAKGLPLVLHPAIPTWGAAIQEYWMIQMLGFPVDTSFALMRLILGGVLERHPDLRVVMPHAGGVAPYWMGRVEHHREAMRDAQSRISHPPSYYFRQIYLDTATPSAATLGFACEFAGADHLLFATDHPWGNLSEGVALVEQLPIAGGAKTQILGENAAALFHLG